MLLKLLKGCLNVFEMLLKFLNFLEMLLNLLICSWNTPKVPETIVKTSKVPEMLLNSEWSHHATQELFFERMSTLSQYVDQHRAAGTLPDLRRGVWVWRAPVQLSLLPEALSDPSPELWRRTDVPLRPARERNQPPPAAGAPGCPEFGPSAPKVPHPEGFAIVYVSGAGGRRELQSHRSRGRCRTRRGPAGNAMAGQAGAGSSASAAGDGGAGACVAQTGGTAGWGKAEEHGGEAGQEGERAHAQREAPGGGASGRTGAAGGHFRGDAGRPQIWAERERRTTATQATVSVFRLEMHWNFCNWIYSSEIAKKVCNSFGGPKS